MNDIGSRAQALLDFRGHEQLRLGVDMNDSRRFIKDFSKLSKPLCELLAKDAKFIWDERCQNSFDQLKQFLTTAPTVRAPNWQLPFEVMCDASDFAIGVVLGQREDGEALCDLLCKQDIERSSEELHNYRERIFQVSGKHKTGSTYLQRFMLIIGRAFSFQVLCRSDNKEVCPLKKSNKESSATAMRMHVEATLPLRK
ncbi:hypothetical protein CK203_100436 [Vitis vinifera]|uniref:Reverse transcriptase/retrotransposon-derived protein RNase H-like domain-containing protein n=1 Tax=Vitis vinifera TaxID=29760 RepID=A0A438CJ49_VITVI|nr:hypothetical protein CK203_100436 [Vitis vinifera]